MVSGTLHFKKPRYLHGSMDPPNLKTKRTTTSYKNNLHPSIYRSIYLASYLSIYLPIYLSTIYPSIHLSFNPSRARLIGSGSGARGHGAVSGAAGLGRGSGGLDLHRVSPAGAMDEEMDDGWINGILG